MIVIFKVYIFSRILKKREWSELYENIYNAKNSTLILKILPIYMTQFYVISQEGKSSEVKYIQ